MNLVRDKRVKDAFMVETLGKMFDRGELKKDHPLQRKPGSWSTDYRDGFIATIIKQEDVDSIKICEQLSEDGVTLWVIDGGHRLTALTDYKNNAFKIGNKIEMYMITYQASEKDESGKTINKNVKYDLRGKRYSDLPNELKEKFDNDKIDVVKHLDCTDEEIAYHIRRYNKQKSMNVAQTSVTYMEKTARYLKDISTNSRFFKDCGVYSPQERLNGTTDRIVMESVMCMFHLQDWKKGGKAIAEYLDEKSYRSEFDCLNENLNILTDIVTKEVDILFNAKDSFIWFTLFDTFKKYNLDHLKFVEFLVAFKNGLNEKPVDGKTFDALAKKSAKDKSVIIDKLHILEILMQDYLCINIEETQLEDDEILFFLKENVRKDITEEDIDIYDGMATEYKKQADKHNSIGLFSYDNMQSLFSIIAYACDEEWDEFLPEWMKDYILHNQLQLPDQKEKYIHMKQDLEQWILQRERVPA